MTTTQTVPQRGPQVKPRGPINPQMIAAILTSNRGDQLRQQRRRELRALEVAEACGGEPGEWATIISELAGDAADKVAAVGAAIAEGEVE